MLEEPLSILPSLHPVAALISVYVIAFLLSRLQGEEELD